MSKYIIKYKLIFIIIITTAFSTTYAAIDPSYGGFFVIGLNSNANFEYNYLEFGTIGELTDKISYEGTIFWEQKTGAEGLVNFRLYKNNLNLMIGKFDVPFGLEYEYLDPPISKFTSLSVVSENFLDGGWNDAGVNLKFKNKLIRVDGFIINSWYGNKAYAPGFRMSSRIYRNIRTGISYTVHLNNDYVKQVDRKDAFISIDFNDFKLESEYISGELVSSSNNIDHAYYIQGIYNLSNIINAPIQSTFRYGIFNGKRNYVTTGLSYQISKENLLKLEYLLNDEGDDKIYSQLAISF
ncbi:MAG: hypothetical protein K9N00_02145 [Candidatus Marinimicrobia bacterium]|nr:hypothetical protein [Candidatus Neomarinimicrobiota bacterium]